MVPIVLVVLDGAGDRPGRAPTPLEASWTPNLDSLVGKGAMGLMYTVGKGIAPESDAGVFSLLGYDPVGTHLSRGVVEAVGAGVQFHDHDLALRAGFATVDGDRLADRRTGRNLSTEEAAELGKAVNEKLRLKEGVEFEFKPTVGHRAVVVFRGDGFRFSSNVSNFDPAYVRKGNISLALKGGSEFEIPRCEALDGSPEAVRTAALVNEFGYKAREVLDHHRVNERRREAGKLPGNFVLMRDAGTEMPRVEGFADKLGMEGLMIADLPAELGIGRILGMSVHQLSPGVSLEDYRRRAETVVQSVGRVGFVYVHLKGPDEPGHDGFEGLKRERIEEIDKGFFSVLRESDVLRKIVLCVTCDHSTPWQDRGHSDDPVPVLAAGGSSEGDGSRRFTELEGAKGSIGMLEKGSLLMERLRQYAA